MTKELNKIDLTTKIVLLNGEKGDSLGKLLSGILTGKTDGINAIKAWGWAQKFFNDEIVEMDDADRKSLKNFIEENKELTNIFKAQLLKELD